MDTFGVINPIDMRLLIQRVSSASVTIQNEMKSKIGKGLLIFVGITDTDSEEDIEWLTHKVAGLRIFDDDQGIPNLSVKDIDGEVLLISQFTLHAKTKKGNRPSYIRAAKPEIAVPLYEHFIQSLEQAIGKKIGTGTFGANMKVALVNDGPFTIWIDSENKE